MIENFHRVTDICSVISSYNAIPKRILDAAADRGKRLHALVEDYVKGAGVWGVDDDLVTYWRDAETWLQDKKIIESERRYYDTAMMLTGQVDLIVEMGGGKWVVDIKTTREPHASWLLQGSAYKHLAELSGHKIDGVMFVQVGPGKPVEYVIEDHFDFFVKAYELYMFKLKMKPKALDGRKLISEDGQSRAAS